MEQPQTIVYQSRFFKFIECYRDIIRQVLSLYKIKNIHKIAIYTVINWLAFISILLVSFPIAIIV